MLKELVHLGRCPLVQAYYIDAKRAQSSLLFTENQNKQNDQVLSRLCSQREGWGGFDRSPALSTKKRNCYDTIIIGRNWHRKAWTGMKAWGCTNFEPHSPKVSRIGLKAKMLLFAENPNQNTNLSIVTSIPCKNKCVKNSFEHGGQIVV